MLIVQRRRSQLLLPTFLLPVLLLAVIASGTSAGRGLRGFPDVSSYLAFVVPGTIMQGTLLAGLTAGIMMAADIEFGFFDRLLAAPVHRTSIVLGRLVGVMALLGSRRRSGSSPSRSCSARATAAACRACSARSAWPRSPRSAWAAIASAIALRTGSLSLLQSLFPFVFVLLFTAPAFFPRTC